MIGNVARMCQLVCELVKSENHESKPNLEHIRPKHRTFPLFIDEGALTKLTHNPCPGGPRLKPQD